MSTPVRIVVMEGDGIGPEITAATMAVLGAADRVFKLGLSFTPVAIGLAAFSPDLVTQDFWLALVSGREIAQRSPKEQFLATELVRPPRVVSRTTVALRRSPSAGSSGAIRGGYCCSAN